MEGLGGVESPSVDAALFTPTLHRSHRTWNSWFKTKSKTTYASLCTTRPPRPIVPTNHRHVRVYGCVGEGLPVVAGEPSKPTRRPNQSTQPVATRESTQVDGAEFTMVMGWIVLLYWTCDVLMSREARIERGTRDIGRGGWVLAQ